MSDYLNHRRKLIADGRPLPQKKQYSIPKKSAKRIKKEKEQKDASGENGLDAYFEHHTKTSYPKCDNCGMVAEWLLEDTGDEKKNAARKTMWRASQAHVLRKKDGIGGFPSVATRLENHLVLFPRWGGYLCGCHDLFDSSYENMAKMAVFPKAIDIINRLYPYIAADERKYLPEIITQEIKPSLYNK